MKEDIDLVNFDDIQNLLWRAEGILAIVNIHGNYLSEEDKAVATQLITSQRANLDRLFTVYRDELVPLLDSIRENERKLKPLNDKLMTAVMMAKQMNGEENVTERGTMVEAVANEAEAMQNGVALVNEPVSAVPVGVDTSEVTVTEAPNTNESQMPVATENQFVTEVPAESGIVAIEAPNASEPPAPVIADENQTATEAPMSFTAGEIPVTTGSSDTNETPAPVTVDENQFVTETPNANDIVVTETPDMNVTPAPVVAGENVTVAPVEGGFIATEAPAVVEEESAIPFVLSPIDEDVAPAVSEEEKTAEEETVAAQPEGTPEAMAADLMISTDDVAEEVTEEEATEKIEQYIKMSDATVKAILVSKSQCEKLLASRTAQKALLGGGEETTNDVVADVSGLPSVDAGVGETVVALPTDGLLASENKEGEGSELPAAESANEAGEDAVIPMISGEAAEASSDAQNNQNELQLMIEQANTLYKEGKVTEAQALFEKIGAMNKGEEGGEANSAASEEPAVLVKK